MVQILPLCQLSRRKGVNRNRKISSMITALIIVVVVFTVAWLFMQGPQFGSRPKGQGSKKINRSVNFKNGQFQNLHETPSLTGGASIFTVSGRFFFGKDKDSRPAGRLPSIKTDLFSLSPDSNVLVWFGHSSYYMQLDGWKILVDPVLSGNAAPFSFATASFRGSDVYQVEEIPDVDFLFITHDHYDHLDYKTIKKLMPKVGKVITGLGVGAHLERWGYAPQMIHEMDWNEAFDAGHGLIVHATPARHFSGRGFKRNGTLWLSFVLQTPGFKIFIGGDSGYDDHFANIGNHHGPFDLAILEDGQYNEYWKFIHMMPEEVVQAAIDLKARALLPVHWSKFSLSLHAWDEPIRRIIEEANKRAVQLAHPMIGEVLQLKPIGETSEWWKKVEGNDNPA
jgi:L-ascorbate metabolism protein UlaG (beta-lactamase superfamily)